MNDQPRPLPRGRMHVMAKPAGPVCNLGCGYCYYLSKAELLPSASGWRMTDATLESFVRQYIEGHSGGPIVFSWQGGEPTLLGIDFFRRVVALQKTYARPGLRCENDLQTNGTLLDDEWCAFLREHRFLVGLSIDGPRELHDRHRVDRGGGATFDRVMRAVRLLRKHGVDFATLTAVHRHTARAPLRVYRFLRDEVRSPRIQFIPIVEPRSFRVVAPQHWPAAEMPVDGSSASRPGNADSVVEEWSVDPDDWGEFLCRIFDEWLERDLGRVFVDTFESAAACWMGQSSPLCTLAPMCGKGLVIEHDGSVFACDHYVYPEYRRGAIASTPLSVMAFSGEQEAFGRAKTGTLPDHCRRCAYQFACFGECPKNRFLRTSRGEPGLNYLCAGWKRFWLHIDAPMRRIARDLMAASGGG